MSVLLIDLNQQNCDLKLVEPVNSITVSVFTYKTDGCNLVFGQIGACPYW